jgi:hypothetical protein
MVGRSLTLNCYQVCRIVASRSLASSAVEGDRIANVRAANWRLGPARRETCSICGYGEATADARGRIARARAPPDDGVPAAYPRLTDRAG